MRRLSVVTATERFPGKRRPHDCGRSVNRSRNATSHMKLQMKERSFHQSLLPPPRFRRPDRLLHAEGPGDEDPVAGCCSFYWSWVSLHRLDLVAGNCFP